MPFRTGPFPPAAVVTSDPLAVAAVATPAAGPSTVFDVLETAGGRRQTYWNRQNLPADNRAMGVSPRTRGEGEVVAVLDTASHMEHEDLADGFAVGPATAGVVLPAPAVGDSRMYAVARSERRGHLGPADPIPVNRTSTVPGAPSRTRIRVPGCHGARA